MATVTAEAIAQAVVNEHKAGTPSLVIRNTVHMALDVFRELWLTHKVLLTSRFRREDRSQHEQRLPDFDANRKSGKLPTNAPGPVCVSTQVIEAGVDISPHRLWSELAPSWPSMLQRLGRLNRKGNDQDPCAWVWETKASGRIKTERIGPLRERRHRARKSSSTRLRPSRSSVRWSGYLQFRPRLLHEVATALSMWRKYHDGRTNCLARRVRETIPRFSIATLPEHMPALQEHRPT